MTDRSHDWNFGDFNQVTVLYETGAKDFFNPPLDDYTPTNFTSPKITDNVARALQRHGLLFLGGDTTIDKRALARHFAWHLS